MKELFFGVALVSLLIASQSMASPIRIDNKGDCQQTGDSSLILTCIESIGAVGHYDFEGEEKEGNQIPNLKSKKGKVARINSEPSCYQIKEPMYIQDCRDSIKALGYFDFDGELKQQKTNSIPL